MNDFEIKVIRILRGKNNTACKTNIFKWKGKKQ